MYNLEQVCGISYSDEKFSELNSDGVLIFLNDPNYSTVQLWNKLNSTVYVNSHEECQHYFLGGFDSSQQLNIELYSRAILLVFLIVVIITKRIKILKK